MEETTTANCKNCSTEIEGDYCHFCGQRYHDHKESFGELVYEFTSDFLHFDSRFFKTVLPLLFIPGKLTKSYNDGQQRSQFHPIRLYLFSSFVYFFLFFTFTKTNEKTDNPDTQNMQSITADTAREANQKSGSTKTADNPDSVFRKINSTLSAIPSIGDKQNEFIDNNDSSRKRKFSINSSNAKLDSLLKTNISPEQYIANQDKLTKDKKDGLLRRIITIRMLKINQQGAKNQREFGNKLAETFLHNIPKMLFFLLPVFALLLKLLYIRRKQFYYVDHAILSLHFFSLIFLLLILSQYILDNIFGTSIFTSIAVLWIFVYLLLAMKRLYGQSKRKTFVKYFLLGILFFSTVLIFVLINLAFTAFMV